MPPPVQFQPAGARIRTIGFEGWARPSQFRRSFVTTLPGLDYFGKSLIIHLADTFVGHFAAGGYRLQTEGALE
jgi:hypothetical protein